MFSITCSPHSFLTLPAQRPARSSSPGATGRVQGVNTSEFAISVVLASIVMYDAAGVRRAVSLQARILNQMIDEMFMGHPMAEKRLRELIGHTPVQVHVGGLLGICVGWLVTTAW